MTSIVNRLQRMEAAAADLYRLAVEDFAGRPEAAELATILRAHEAAAGLLAECSPLNTDFEWDYVDALVGQLGSLYAAGSALAALRGIEQHLNRECAAALSTNELPAAAREVLELAVGPAAEARLEAVTQLADA